MTIKQAYKFLIEDYYYATDEGKEALETIIYGYDYLYQVDYLHFLSNRQRVFKGSKPSDFVDARDKFEKTYKLDLSKLEQMKED